MATVINTVKVWFVFERFSIMRVSKAKAAANQERILAQAARLFRERGLDGIGVDELTRAAGMTHGSLYSRFGSKEELAAEAIGHAFASTAAKWDDVKSLKKYTDTYLSAAHRDGPGEGCTISALGCEIPRQGKSMKQRFTSGVRQSMARIVRLLNTGNERRREDNAIVIMTTMLGAVVLARAVDDEALSERILKIARAQVALIE
jgi:TetR/AcrR family transcriptional regulator, transcriptional repressor for nem operon